MADPRQALVQQMMQSQRGSPDLPGRGAIQELNNSGDAGWKQFIDQFGLERERNPNGPPPGYIPMPRPRMPDMQVGSSPLGDEALVPPAAGLKTSDIARTMQDASAVEGVPMQDQMSDEDMLNHVQGQMGGGEFDWEGGDGAPTNNDIKYAMQDDDLKEQFIKHFGAPPEEFQGNENEPDNDPDDQGD
jgi:hypothetical protein